MKLGKALATGVAEERPLVREEQAPLPGAAATDTATDRVEPAEPAREEVPAAR